MTTPTRIATPETVYAEFWPANILLPDGSVRRKVRAYLTDVGLLVFYTRPTDDLAPHFHAPIDFAHTVEPNRSAHNVGVDVRVFLGEGQDISLTPDTATVVITPTGGCGCGNSLRHWKPSWAGRITEGWPA